jgi:5'-nucleotidase
MTPADPAPQFVPPPRHRRIFCNRTLNLRQVQAIGYDMDYTLIHYRMESWEKRAYQHAQAKLASQGWPVQNLRFLPDLMVRGLVIDSQLGNILKVNTFGYVKHAFHGTKPLEFEEQRATYARVVVSLSEKRYVFLNTLFSLSEACLYAQLVDKLDAQELPSAMGYEEVYRQVRASIDGAHLEGQLKDEIMAHPQDFVERDPDTALALLDQRHAGKKLLLITNSDWHYTRFMMSYVFDRDLPGGMVWRDLFDYVLVAARKPSFFEQRAPLFGVVSDDGLLKPVATMQPGGAYWGGDASLVEASLGLEGDQILYVGDHIYGDVNVSKTLLRWRTALVLRELEGDLAALQIFAPNQERLRELMVTKETYEAEISYLRLLMQRCKTAYGAASAHSERDLQQQIARVRARALALDEAIRPLAEAAAKVPNANWGSLMRAGNDKSHLARQVERYADIYMSRVSNFLWQTPFSYMRALRGTLPHDILDTADG